jgi:4-nitrophenyl phosphatase
LLTRRNLGKRVIFVTNNSTQSRQDQALRLRKYGIDVRPKQIINSSYSAARHISQVLKLPANRNKVFVLGTTGIEDELDEWGIPHVGGSDALLQRDTKTEDLAQISDGSLLDPSVGVVVVGMDVKFNYLKLCLAAHYIKRGAIYLSTNTDATWPAYGTVFPAAACIIDALFSTVQQQPLLLGKPSLHMMDAVRGDFELDLKRTCMIGDSLATDMSFAVSGGLGGFLLVLSGVTRVEECPSAPIALDHYLVLNSIADLNCTNI